MKGLQTIKRFLEEQGEPVRITELSSHLRSIKANTPRDLRTLREAIREQDLRGQLRLLALQDGEFIPYPPPPTKTPMYVALPDADLAQAPSSEAGKIESKPAAIATPPTAANPPASDDRESAPDVLSSPETLRAWMDKHRIKHFKLEIRRAE